MLFRFPGGKSRLAKIIIPKLLSYEPENYCEPFAGAAHVGLRLLETVRLDKFWLNDADYGIYCIWKTVKDKPEALGFMIKNYIPTIEDFFKFKIDLKTPFFFSISEVAFRKLVLHQISYSGLGELAGGPIGGKSQQSAYDVACRWNRIALLNKIDKIHYLLTKQCKECIITWIDGVAALFSNFLYFIDPPYFEKGNELYKIKFNTIDHTRLAHRIRKMTSPWILTYDNNNTIRKLYSWANIQEISVTYTINTARQNKEILIC